MKSKKNNAAHWKNKRVSPSSLLHELQKHILCTKTRRKTTKGKEAGVVAGRLLSRFIINSWQVEVLFQSVDHENQPDWILLSQKCLIPSFLSIPSQAPAPFPPGFKKRFFDWTANQVAPPTPFHSFNLPSSFPPRGAHPARTPAKRDQDMSRMSKCCCMIPSSLSSAGFLHTDYHPRNGCMWTKDAFAFPLLFGVVTIYPRPPSTIIWDFSVLCSLSVLLFLSMFVFFIVV